MKRIALCLILFLLVTSAVSAQGDSTLVLPDSFAFDYTAHLAVEGLASFGFSADLSGSGKVDRAAPAFDLGVKGAIRLGSSQTISLDNEYRWVDDTFLFLHPDDVWQEWGSASAYLGMLIEAYAVVAVDWTPLTDWDLSGIDGWSDLISALTSSDPSAFLSAQKLADEGDSAHFQSTLDLRALMQTDAFVNAVAVFAATQGNNLIVYDHADLAKIVRANSALFENATVTLDQYVGLSDNLLHRIVLNLDMPLDPIQLGYPDPPFKVSASLDMTLSDLNQPQAIVMPEQTIEMRSVSDEVRSTQADEGALQMVYFESRSEFEGYTRTFEAQAGDKVTLTARGIGLEFDPDLILLDASGVTLAENDDHETAAFGLGDTDSQIADFVIPTSGTYTAQVSELDGGSGEFVLTIDIQR
ncbi:MAG: PPC domain-containing protein [Chloroflexota bacterium]